MCDASTLWVDTPGAPHSHRRPEQPNARGVVGPVQREADHARLFAILLVVALVLLIAPAAIAAPSLVPGTTGNLLAQIGSTGTGDGQFQNSLRQIAVDTNGDIYALDSESSSSPVQVFNSSGVFLRKWGSSGSADGSFLQPMGI